MKYVKLSRTSRNGKLRQTFRDGDNTPYSIFSFLENHTQRIWTINILLAELIEINAFIMFVWNCLFASSHSCLKKDKFSFRIPLFRTFLEISSSDKIHSHENPIESIAILLLLSKRKLYNFLWNSNELEN